MPPSALPLISEQDYPRFQQIIQELRHTTYEEWHDDHMKSVAYRRPRNGFEEIPVSPAEFDTWLKEHRQLVHLELLWVFAESKAARLVKPASVQRSFRVV